MYTAEVQDDGSVSATDVERLPPGGFSLRHGFPTWFSRGRKIAGERQSSGQQSVTQTPPRQPEVSLSSGGTSTSKSSAVGESPGYAETDRVDVSTFEVLQYIRSTFDDENVLDSIPLTAAGNPGAWHAWRTHQIGNGKVFDDIPGGGSGNDGSGSATSAVPTRRPGEWNWEGVWEERVKKAISASLSEPVMYGGIGAADDVVCLHSP
jgi:hypothetical protein